VSLYSMVERLWLLYLGLCVYGNGRVDFPLAGWMWVWRSEDRRRGGVPGVWR